MLKIFAMWKKGVKLSVASITVMISVLACADITPLNNVAQQDAQKGSVYENVAQTENEAWLDAPEEDARVALKIGKINLLVEYADSPQERALGLMYRRELCDNCGMLFKFSSVRVGSIWMKNTFIPLDLAYISEQGVIVDIAPLQPHNLTPVLSSSEVLYALEMNLGWFASQDIRVGDTVSLLP